MEVWINCELAGVRSNDGAIMIYHNHKLTLYKKVEVMH